MSYALLVFIPFGVSTCAYLARRARTLAAWMSIGAIALEVLLAVGLSDRGQLLGIAVDVHPVARLILVATLTLMAATFFYAWLMGRDSSFFASGLATAGAITASILTMSEPFVASAFVMLSALFAAFGLLPQYGSKKHAMAAARYISSMVMAGICLLTAFMVVGEFLVAREPLLARVATAAVVMGLAILLAAFPFHFWLPRVIEQAPIVASALLIGPIGMLGVGFFIATVDGFPSMLADERTRTLAMLVGTQAALGGAVLAYSQRRLTHLLAYSLASAAGATIVGLASGSILGIGGAVLSSLGNALSATLALMCLGLASEDGSAPADDRLMGLKSRQPFTLIALLIAGLGLAGLPPFVVFPGRWMIYEAAALREPLLALALIAASAILVLAHARSLHRLMSSAESAAPSASHPRGATRLILSMALLSIVVGLYPAPILELINAVLSQMPSLL
ncbi:MAG: hypothetical protein HY675_03520 [Chloroflexi bacterium]|nr:hypothetical protein [Chloroflexota bacterium]